MADALAPFSFRRNASMPGLMGILNITPDSFHGPSRQHTVEQSIQNAKGMIAAGAEIIDIGGESTRPGSEPVSIEEELERVLPVITALREESKSVHISIDTRNHDKWFKSLKDRISTSCFLCFNFPCLTPISRYAPVWHHHQLSVVSSRSAS